MTKKHSKKPVEVTMDDIDNYVDFERVLKKRRADIAYIIDSEIKD